MGMPEETDVLKKTDEPEVQQAVTVSGNVGLPERWTILSNYVSGDGKTRTTRAMEIPNYGCIVTTCLREKGIISETTVVVPRVGIAADKCGGNKLELRY